MKTLFLTILSLLGLGAFSNTIGVAPIKTFGLYADNNVVQTLTQLELIKLGKYSVLDKYDMQEAVDMDEYQDCYGKSCLIDYGKLLKTDYLLSGSIDGLGTKIVISLKIIDVRNEKIINTKSIEFRSEEKELQRMIGIVLEEMHDIVPDPEVKNRLVYNGSLVIIDDGNKVNNAGPRMGVAYTVGTLNEFATRDAKYGGLDIAPIVSNFGYQFEGQYVGTEKFSALIEGVFNLTALEQGKFIPSFSLLNGFRFGKQGWEFAFGPSFGFTKTSVGFFSEEGKELFGESEGRYWTETEFNQSTYSENTIESYGYEFNRFQDTRGRLDFNTRWIMAFGRTFRSGALNIPVNVFYSSEKGGGMAGLSVGFNITKSRR